MIFTENFSLEELCVSDTAVRLGIDNTPHASALVNLSTLAEGLERVRRVLGHPMRILSGYRCEELERALTAKDFAAWCHRHGKITDSESDTAAAWREYYARKAHPQGWAGDFICPAFGTPVEIVQVLRKSGIAFDQLIEEGSWVHVSFDPRMRGQVLAATFARDGTPSYSSAPIADPLPEQAA